MYIFKTLILNGNGIEENLASENVSVKAMIQRILDMLSEEKIK